MDVGDRFPDFVLADENGEAFDCSMLEGLRYIIYFYSKDSTPGCTTEAVEFTANVPKLMMRNIAVIGVSKDSSASHRKFMDSNRLKVKLLSDPDHALMEKVGAWGPKKLYGKETVGTIRSTFLVGKDGRIEQAWHNVKAAGHADKVTECALSKFRTSQ